MNAIEVKDLRKTYGNGTEALKGVTMEIKSGDFFGLLGANGAGKTTMIGILTSIVNKTSGDAKIFDFNVETEIDKAKEMVGVVPQEFNFNIFETVMDIVVTQAGYFGVEKAVATERAEEILKALSLWDKRNDISMSLSGGMKRRLMIARALIHKPKLLILDEPTAGVDVKLRHGMWEYLKDLNEKGTSILLTTHYIEEAEELCNNVAIINKGEIVKQGRVNELLSSVERHTYVLNLSKMPDSKQIEDFEIKKIDHETIEVDFGADLSMNKFIKLMNERDITVSDIKPKGNKLEKLFLSFLKK